MAKILMKWTELSDKGMNNREIWPNPGPYKEILSASWLALACQS